MNCRFQLTDNKQVFKNSTAYKISYSTHSEKEIINVSPHDLLYKVGVDESYRPKGVVKKGLLYFHVSDSSCDLGFDIFSSVFYLISRYEEWQRFDKDEHGRFELDQSILFKNNAHLRPLINIWIEEFKQALLKLYPEVKFPKKKFQYISTIDVDNLYAYKQKGLLRVLGACAKDMIKFQFGKIIQRLKVVQGKVKDPFDVYSELNEHSRSKNIPLFYFFLQRTGTKYDRTVDPLSGAFKQIFDHLNKAEVRYGLHPSYNTLHNSELLKEELQIIEKSSGNKIQVSRQHYLRWDINTSPKQLILNGIKADFSMGFAAGAGYRAGTFTPFYYYDLENESATNLLIVPFVVMDGVYFVYSNTGAKEAKKEILKLADETRKLNGVFVTVFHERTFDSELYPGFAELYWELQQELC